MRVVADTNIFISALMFDGLPGAFLQLAMSQSFQLVTSDALLEELDEKLRLKFKVSVDDARLLQVRLRTCAQVVRPGPLLSVVKDDPDDDRVLECAVAGTADAIVSGDRHLLRLTAYAGVRVLTVRQFMDGFIRK